MNTPHLITSLTNDRVKAIRALEMRKTRRETGLFVAEGLSILISARDLGRWPETLVYQAGTAGEGPARGLVTAALQRGVECLEVSAAILEKLSQRDNPQTMLGVYKQTWSTPPPLSALKPDDVWLALEEIRDPGNLGTILRTVDAFGIKGVILIGSCVDAHARECIRATMGSIFAVPLARHSREEFPSWRKSWPGDVVGTHLSANEDVRAFRPKRPVLVVMGSEGPGLSDEMTKACSRLVKIPMAGRLDSLNLAVATAITLFELKRDALKL